MSYLHHTSFPVLLLAFCGLFELSRLFYVRRIASGDVPSWLRLLTWAERPWAGWALFNIVYRWLGTHGFNAIKTFPFFCHTWFGETPIVEAFLGMAEEPMFWMWTGIVLVLLGLTAGLLYLVLTRDLSARAMVVAVLGQLLLTVGLQISVTCLPFGHLPVAPNRPSALTSAWKTHTTVLYTVPMVRSTSHLLRHFEERHQHFRPTIHGYSHPPGAAISMYWIGHLMGVDGEDIRKQSVVLRYLIGLTLVGSLNVLVLYGLGQGLFNSRRVGFLTATLWCTQPATLIYGTFAHDTVYALFFNLALLLTWRCARATRRTYLWAPLLGIVLYALAMMNYSWCIVATVFAVFVGLEAWRSRWSRSDLLVRLGLPLAIAGAGLLYTVLHYSFDYLGAFRRSSDYVSLWYQFTGIYQWLAALVGGQIEILILSGSVACSAFLLTLRNLRREDLRRPEVAFLLVLLGVYAIPILVGPNPLKMETARCWSWIMALPLAFTAKTLLSQPSPRLFAIGAPVLSVLTYTGMRWFLDFAP